MGQALTPKQHDPQAASSSPMATSAMPATVSTTPMDAADASQPTLPYAPFAAPASRADQPPEHGPHGNRLWQGIKWPLRKLLLGAYLAVDALRVRPRVALAVGVVALLALIAGGVAFATTRSAAPAVSTVSTVSVEQPALPALPNSVLHFLSARQHYDAAGMWSACDTQGHSDLRLTEPQLQAALNQHKQAGEAITRYVYTGGYRAPDGTAHYTIEMYVTQRGHVSVLTLYFVVGTNDLIHRYIDLTA